MSEIINFPTKAVRDNMLVEKTIKDILDKTPANEETKKEIINRVVEIFNMYQCEFSPVFDLSLPDTITEDEKRKLLKSIENSYKEFEKALHDHMNKIIFERIQAEIKIYFLENPI